MPSADSGSDLSFGTPVLIADVLRATAALANDVAPALLSEHFRRIRNRPRYVRDYSPSQIAGHVRLLSQMNADSLVVVSVREGVERGEFEIEVCGADVRGASAVLTGCIADLGMSIIQLEVHTWEDEDDDELLLTGRYLIVLRSELDGPASSAQSLQERLSQRLKGAYWHLVRGDVQRARLEADQSDELIGQVIESRFRVDRRLGEGGMGRIYLATQLELNRPVALKILSRELSGDPTFAANFQRESRLMAQIRSSSLVQVYAAGLYKDQGWIAMEYLSGGDVAHFVARHGVPHVTQTARWLQQTLRGLEYIHNHVGIVHCDLKPANFLLDGGQNVKIGDLGLSQLQHLSRLVASDGKISGTLWYMSPEQAQGRTPDERSDLFSLGSAFYHILSGRPPFDAASPAEILTRVIRVDCPPLSEAAPNVPPGLAVLIERLMQQDPLRRYQDAAVARADLESYLTRNRLQDPDEGESAQHDSSVALAFEVPTTPVVPA